MERTYSVECIRIRIRILVGAFVQGRALVGADRGVNNNNLVVAHTPVTHPRPV